MQPSRPVELRAQYGMLTTDFSHIKAGALHRANGGYLVLDARVLLRQPLAWEAIKQPCAIIGFAWRRWLNSRVYWRPSP